MNYQAPAYQNSAQILGWLAITERIRGKARLYSRISLLVSIFLAGLTLALYTSSTTSLFPAIMGGAVSLAVLLLERIQSKAIKRVAELKDHIDSRLAGLPTSWMNQSTISPEEEAALQIHPERDLNRFLNWYPDASGLPDGFRVLLWQRGSAVWDIALRRGTSLTAQAAAGGIILSILTIGVTLKLSTIDLVTQFAIPLLPLMIYSLRAAIRNEDIARQREDVVSLAESLWHEAIKKPHTDIAPIATYVVKDALFQIRRQSPPSPQVLESLAKRRLLKQAAISAHVLKTHYEETQTGQGQTPQGVTT